MTELSSIFELITYNLYFKEIPIDWGMDKIQKNEDITTKTNAAQISGRRTFSSFM